MVTGNPAASFQKRTLPPAGIHYSTPVILISALLCGIGFALGHHFFYQSLNTEPTLNEAVVLKVSQQRFNLAVGNALAFAVKVCLGVAASTAYFQAFWRTMRTTAKGQRLSILDATFSILDDARNFLQVQVWYRYPLMVSIAALSWCIPLASIITPSTLTVKNVPREPALVFNVTTPNLEFANINFLKSMNYHNETDVWAYFGPNDALRRLATATMTSGEVLHINPPAGHVNASWSTSFWGPSLTCGNVSKGEEREIRYNLLNNYGPSTISPSPHWECITFTSFASWSIGDHQIPGWLPYPPGYPEGGIRRGNLGFGYPQQTFVSVTPLSRDQFQRLCGTPSDWLHSGRKPGSVRRQELPIMYKIYGKPDSAKDQYLPELFDTATLIKCKAVNASYTVKFNYVNGQQDLDITVNKTDQVLVPIGSVTGPVMPLQINTSAVDLSETTRADCSTFNTQGKRCVFDVKVLRTLGYQAVIDSFWYMVNGDMTKSNPAVQRIVYYNTRITTTRLMDTTELGWVFDYDSSFWSPEVSNLTDQMLSQAGRDYVGLSRSGAMRQKVSLGSAIEEMFTNLTVSLMSDSFFLPNYTSSFAPQPSQNITSQDFHNVYEYDSTTLWTAYGAAIGTACILVLIGFVVIHLNGAAYDNKFSTIFRVSKNGELVINTSDDQVDKDHRNDDGRRPLPDDLSRGIFKMNCTELKQESKSLLGERDRRTASTPAGGR